jgi:hypothetical protein
MQIGLWRTAEEKWPQSAETVGSSRGRRTLGDSSGNRITTEFPLGGAGFDAARNERWLAAAPTGGSGKGVRE